MAEIGLIRDHRCSKALDRLQAKQLPGGGWAAERQLYKVSAKPGTRTDSVDWGGASPTACNEWVTVDALAVLKAAGRIRGGTADPATVAMSGSVPRLPGS